MSPPRAFADLHALARRASRRPEEADDLLQSALLAALESGRTDLASPETRRWLSGVIRNRAAFDARTAGRRKKRESAWRDAHGMELPQGGQAAQRPFPHPEEPPEGGVSKGEPRGSEATLPDLPPSLRLTALLALSGHTRQEIGWLLNLSDAALRQRISQLKRALANAPTPAADPTGDLAFGRIRRALLGPARRENAFLASHDPDGHLFVVSRSQIPAPRQQTRG
jgi:DNA-directed RNA polymerase specialized sigma24 family protein